jgi:hypothetical protein
MLRRGCRSKSQEGPREKLSRPPAVVVFDIVRDSERSQCKKELPRGSFLLMEAGQPLCISCAESGPPRLYA